MGSFEPGALFVRLHEAGIKYVVVGGFAVIAHGVQRNRTPVLSKRSIRQKRDTARTMSQENVELVRQANDSVNRGDIRRALEEADDDFEMDWSNSIGPLKGVYRGRAQVIGFWESFSEAWNELRWDMQELVELDEEQVLVVNRVRMRGHASGVDVQGTGAQVWTIRNGKLGSVKLYQSKAEALEAVGRVE